MKKFLSIAMTGFFAFSAQANTSEEGLLFKVTGSPNNIHINTVVPNHYYPAAGIKLNTPGYSITSGCSTIANGSCLFGVSDTQQATITATGNASPLNFILCLDGNGLSSCQNYSLTKTNHLAYITSGNDISPFVSVCTLDPATGDIDSCENAASDSTVESILATGQGFSGIVLNNDATIAYLSASGIYSVSQAYQCSIDAQGLFNTCSIITISPSYYSYYGELALNTAGTILYLINASINPNTVLACAVVGGTIDGNCTDTGATNINGDSVQITVNHTDTIAYIGNYSDHYVTVCDISNNGISFGPCYQKENGTTAFDGPSGVALNSSGNTLYIADYHSGNIYGCDTTPNGSARDFTSCFLAYSSISHAWSIAVNANDTTAYVTTYGDTYVCPIQSDGTFASCTVNTDAPDATGISLTH